MMVNALRCSKYLAIESFDLGDYQSLSAIRSITALTYVCKSTDMQPFDEFKFHTASSIMQHGTG